VLQIMASTSVRIIKKRGAAAMERKRQHDGGSFGIGAKGYAIVVDGGQKTIGARIRSNDNAATAH
jgi:hypothetical protein